MSTEDDVRNASNRFYAALNAMLGGDPSQMAGVWSHAGDVTTMHPIGGCEVGWEQVEAPWAAVAAMSSGGEVELNDALIRVSGDMACEIGVERGQMTVGDRRVEIVGRVTNVYRNEAGDWKIIHHHTDLSPEIVEIVSG